MVRTAPVLMVLLGGAATSGTFFGDPLQGYPTGQHEFFGNLSGCTPSVNLYLRQSMERLTQHSLRQCRLGRPSSRQWLQRMLGTLWVLGLIGTVQTPFFETSAWLTMNLGLGIRLRLCKETFNNDNCHLGLGILPHQRAPQPIPVLKAESFSGEVLPTQRPDRHIQGPVQVSSRTPDGRQLHIHKTPSVLG